MTRQETNRLILKQILAMVEGAPDLRFQQILINMGINQTQLVGTMPNEIMMCKDLYHEESIKTLERINKKMLKSKIFNFFAVKLVEGAHAQFYKERDEHNREISEFIEQLGKDGNTFINMNSVGYGRFESVDRIRTIIIYIENQTRKVLVEKIKS